MRLRNVKNKEILINNCSYLLLDLKNINWTQEFNNSNPIHLEIGMGKGDFIYQMALTYPNINFVGIEKYTGVIAKAIKKYPFALPNLRIINIDALNLKEIFNHEISTIYLNFSDPWPKKRHAERRLTSPTFLKIYDALFKSSPKIILKTDNINFFASSLITLSNYGYKFSDVNLDFPNIPTEYETKFMAKGIKINYLVAIKDKPKN